MHEYCNAMAYLCGFFREIWKYLRRVNFLIFTENKVERVSPKLIINICNICKGGFFSKVNEFEFPAKIKSQIVKN